MPAAVAFDKAVDAAFQECTGDSLAAKAFCCPFKTYIGSELDPCKAIALGIDFMTLCCLCTGPSGHGGDCGPCGDAGCGGWLYGCCLVACSMIDWPGCFVPGLAGDS
eukprot:TRINITY_DN78894_c0_g1_i1.p1 TRINITY_DN78894_c0_g1~~TRINITY_DN78894_c0_g1_i1.p1  ORF type:complete len:107 (-),score=16.10 TRINITY_DN78894_c0_g1_i1:93-413(-)